MTMHARSHAQHSHITHRSMALTLLAICRVRFTFMHSLTHTILPPVQSVTHATIAIMYCVCVWVCVCCIRTTPNRIIVNQIGKCMKRISIRLRICMATNKKKNKRMFLPCELIFGFSVGYKIASGERERKLYTVNECVLERKYEMRCIVSKGVVSSAYFAQNTLAQEYRKLDHHWIPWKQGKKSFEHRFLNKVNGFREEQTQL